VVEWCSEIGLSREAEGVDAGEMKVIFMASWAAAKVKCHR